MVVKLKKQGRPMLKNKSLLHVHVQSNLSKTDTFRTGLNSLALRGVRLIETRGNTTLCSINMHLLVKI